MTELLGLDLTISEPVGGAPIADLPVDFQKLLDPTDLLQELRERHPVWRIRSAAGMNAWLLLRYDDIVHALRDPRFSSDPMNANLELKRANAATISGFFKVFHRSMVAVDPPDHTRLRRIVAFGFTPHRGEQFRAKARQVANDLLDTISGQTDVDLVPTYTDPLPLTVLCDALGIPAEHVPDLLHWCDDVSLTPINDEARALADRAYDELLRFFGDLLDAKSRAPEADVLSRLAVAHNEGEIDEVERLSMAISLLLGGQETTKGALSGAILGLLRAPEQLAALRSDPSLIQAAVEELVRHDGPAALAVHRYTTEDVEVAGVVIPQGEQVFFDLLSANHDPRQFKEPAGVDFHRGDNPQVGFGGGIHHCIGRHLGRVEIQEAVNALLARCPDVELGVPFERLRCRHTVVRCLATLPVTGHFN